MLSKEQLSTFRSQLIKAKQGVEELLKNSDHYDLENASVHETMGELSNYDNHPADNGSALYEREKDIALNEHSEEELKEINYALQAIENGSYGKCEECGKDIPIDRLKAIPTTTFCIEHSPSQVTSHVRPIEEEILSPPWGKFVYDDRDAVMFDAEDSWQDVARYGTSESPSDFVDAVDDYNETYIEADEPIGYVEAYENFIGTDIDGKNITIYPNTQHEIYEDSLDDEGLMTIWGDLPPYEIDPYTEEEAEEEIE
ncbi:TraR/DksA C4-type zinc finger protein [Ferdinandcohnia quinoae]|uniref:TraR/DksA C4-type zinc finger protein n=1 Tax=Fredinandcohnia quinoae TaxID=2918902 RepID=A0AAW5DXQ6_9BACI|nr:TraR/DksA C4-type zinc finger protein [Fredinandcohnia sp. SECRCQ15]MCH1625441.1 TraR/DksA C4-type zinc finger protein [Fredinandcohnia sp. SECRCQ15]